MTIGLCQPVKFKNARYFWQIKGIKCNKNKNIHTYFLCCVMRKYRTKVIRMWILSSFFFLKIIFMDQNSAVYTPFNWVKKKKTLFMEQDGNVFNLYNLCLVFFVFVLNDNKKKNNNKSYSIIFSSPPSPPDYYNALNEFIRIYK